MSGDSWPETGAGVRKEPGRGGRSGSRRSQDMYNYWLDTMEHATRGKAVMIFVDRARFYANLKTIRKQLGGDEPGVNMASINERIRAGIKAYGEAIKSGQIGMAGKPAWPVFMRMWPKYVDAATVRPATEEERASGKRRWDE